MNIHYLRYFISVAEHLSFSKAASKLYIAQPGLSQGIANLEKTLGFKLFDRDRRTVRLTPAGIVFLKEATEIVTKYDEAVIKARQANTCCVETLNIGFLPSLGKVGLRHWISGFHQEYPDCELNVNQYIMATLHPALEEGSVDLGYTRSFGLVDTTGYNFHNISTDSISVVVRKDHPFADFTSVNLLDLAGESFLMLPPQEAPQWHKYATKVFGNRGLSPKIITPGRMEGIYILAEAGVGIGMITSSSRTTDFKDVCFIPVEGEDAQFETGLAWKNSNRNPIIPLFLDFIRSSYHNR